MNSPQRSDRLPLSHLLLALAIVAVWGTNFVVIKISLEAFPPFLFAALRYFFALLPMVFFVKEVCRYAIHGLCGEDHKRDFPYRF